MSRTQLHARSTDEHQELAASRREPRAPEEVFHDYLKKHTAIKAQLHDGSHLQRAESRRIGLARLQFGDGEPTESLLSFSTSSSRAQPLPQMEQPVQLTRTMSRTLGLGASFRRRTNHSMADDEDSDTETDFESDLWAAGVSGLLGEAATPGAARVLTRSSTGFSTSAVSRLRSSLTAQQDDSAASGQSSPACGGEDPAAMIADHCSSTDVQDGTDPSGRLDRPTERVDQLLKDLRSNDPRSGASLFMASNVFRSARAASTGSNVMLGGSGPAADGSGTVQRARSNAAVQMFEYNQELLQAEVQVHDAMRNGGATRMSRGNVSLSGAAAAMASRCRLGAGSDTSRRGPEMDEATPTVPSSPRAPVTHPSQRRASIFGPVVPTAMGGAGVPAGNLPTRSQSQLPVEGSVQSVTGGMARVGQLESRRQSLGPYTSMLGTGGSGTVNPKVVAFQQQLQQLQLQQGVNASRLAGSPLASGELSSGGADAPWDSAGSGSAGGIGIRSSNNGFRSRRASTDTFGGLRLPPLSPPAAAVAAGLMASGRGRVLRAHSNAVVPTVG